MSGWFQADADPVRADCRADRLRHSQGEAVTARNVAPLAVGPLVHDGIEELLDQVAIRRMQFHTG